MGACPPHASAFASPLPEGNSRSERGFSRDLAPPGFGHALRPVSTCGENVALSLAAAISYTTPMETLAATLTRHRARTDFAIPSLPCGTSTERTARE